MVIELMTFRLRPGVAEADFLAADRLVQTQFAYQQVGLIRRTTARNEDGKWLVADLWASTADADGCLEGWHRHPAPVALMALVDDATVGTERFETLD